ncbi:MAG: hypothetical protein AAF236_00660 [Verrucomicrobiota bacterium]
MPDSPSAWSFEALMGTSPFSRPLTLSDTVILSGVATVDGRQVVTLIDTELGRSIAISDQPNREGWKMVSLDKTDDIETTVASIAVGTGEIIRVFYNEERLKLTTQRMRYEARARSQRAAASIAARRSNHGGANGGANHGVAPQRVALLKRIATTELPETYEPGKGRNREESHQLHQGYVDRRLSGLSSRQRGMVGQLWQQQQTVSPQMPNRGASFVRILEHVAENEPR